MAAMYRRLHRLLPRHPRQLLTDKCFPAHLRCAPDCMSCCHPTCRCTPRGVLHLAASPMRLVRQRYKAGSEIRRGEEPHVEHMGHPAGRHCHRASEMRRIYFLRMLATRHALWSPPHDAALRPGRRSGGAQNPMWHTWGTRLADTAIALRRCAGYGQINFFVDFVKIAGQRCFGVLYLRCPIY